MYLRFCGDAKCPRALTPSRRRTPSLAGPQTGKTGPEDRRERRLLQACGQMSGRLPAHAEQVECAAVGQRHELQPPAAVGVFTGEAQRVPAHRMLAPDRQLGQVVDPGVEPAGAGLPAVEVRIARTCISVGTCSIRRRARASLDSARNVRRAPTYWSRHLRRNRRSRGGSPPVAAIRLLLIVRTSFRGLLVGPESSPRGRRVCGYRYEVVSAVER